MTARLATATNVQLPSFRYSERHGGPSRCAHCGARLLIGDVPTADSPRVDVGCLMCSRPSHELTYDGLRAPMTPEQFRALGDQARKPGRPLGSGKQAAP